jgi:hypothetical protein
MRLAVPAEAIFYDDVIVTWVGRPPPQFHEGLFFAPYTFSHRSRALIRVQKGKIRVLVRITYFDTIPHAACGNSCSQRCKVEPQPYTDFTPAVRMKPTMRSIIWAVI